MHWNVFEKITFCKNDKKDGNGEWSRWFKDKNTESTTWGKLSDLEKMSRYFRKNILYEAFPWWDDKAAEKKKKKRTVVYLDVTCGKLKFKPVSQLVPLCCWNTLHGYAHWAWLSRTLSLCWIQTSYADLSFSSKQYKFIFLDIVEWTRK